MRLLRFVNTLLASLLVIGPVLWLIPGGGWWITEGVMGATAASFVLTMAAARRSGVQAGDEESAMPLPPHGVQTRPRAAA